MRDWKRPGPSTARPPAHDTRFALRLSRGGPRRRAPHEGRLGVDLRGDPGVQHSGLDAGFQSTFRRPRLALPWRRPLPAPRVGLPLGDDRRPRHRLLRSPALVALLLAQVALVALAAWALTSPRWEIRHVDVQGTGDPTLSQEIRGLRLDGCNIFRCDLAQRIRQVEALPAVARADVHAVFPDTLVVVVAPRLPALVLHTGGGAFVLADDGVVLGAPESDPAWDAARLPALEDPNAALAGGAPLTPGTRLDATHVKVAAQLRNGVHGALGDGWTLQYSRDGGFAAAGPAGAQVRFGALRDVASVATSDLSAETLGDPPDAATLIRGAQRQIGELRAIVKSLADHHQKAALIDLRWGDHPYVRLSG